VHRASSPVGAWTFCNEPRDFGTRCTEPQCVSLSLSKVIQESHERMALIEAVDAMDLAPT
jgi:hypothetical protein